MRSSTTGERCAAFFLLGLVAFNPPLLQVFSRQEVVFGVPVLYAYLFVAWAALIAFIALTVGRKRVVRAGASGPNGGAAGRSTAERAGGTGPAADGSEAG